MVIVLKLADSVGKICRHKADADVEQVKCASVKCRRRTGQWLR